MVRICVWGDSITRGYYDEEGGWCERLKKYIITHKDNVSVYNLGISGDDSNDLLARYEVEIMARKPDIIVFAIGINDSKYYDTPQQPRIALEQYKANLAQLLEISLRYTDKIAFIGLTAVDDSRTNPIPWDQNKTICLAQAHTQKYDTVLKKFCEEHKLIYIDLSEVVGLEDLEDGLHPNTQGHKKMFERIRDELQKKFTAFSLENS